MAAKTIKVDPEQLRTWANEISNLGGDYQSNYWA